MMSLPKTTKIKIPLEEYKRLKEGVTITLEEFKRCVEMGGLGIQPNEDNEKLRIQALEERQQWVDTLNVGVFARRDKLVEESYKRTLKMNKVLEERRRSPPTPKSPPPPYCVTAKTRSQTKVKGKRVQAGTCERCEGVCIENAEMECESCGADFGVKCGTIPEYPRYELLCFRFGRCANCREENWKEAGKTGDGWKWAGIGGCGSEPKWSAVSGNSAKTPEKFHYQLGQISIHVRKMDELPPHGSYDRKK